MEVVIVVIRLKLLYSDATLPSRGTEGSVGFDIRAHLTEPIIIEPLKTVTIGSGFAIALDLGYAAFIYARSGLGIKKGIIPANCVGVIDSDYRGEIIVGLKNTSANPYVVKPNDKIAQMVVSKCEIDDIVICDELDDTERGVDGFGSTGIQ